MDRTDAIPAHIESLARKLEAWMATDLIDSERDVLRQVLVAAASGTDEVAGFAALPVRELLVRSEQRATTT